MLHTQYGCRATIEKLRKDNDALKEELLLANKFSVTPTDTSTAHRITAMQDEADGLTRKVRRSLAALMKQGGVVACALLAYIQELTCAAYMPHKRRQPRHAQGLPQRPSPRVQIQMEQRRVALAEVELQGLSGQLAQQQAILKVSGGITSATDKAVALQKEIKRGEARRQQARPATHVAITHEGSAEFKDLATLCTQPNKTMLSAGRLALYAVLPQCAACGLASVNC